ncbi:MAG: hypothetical protein H6525_04910 [Actinobacteria bacterium]|nr:hypothetical protein [Actinomycetota bacterium]
MCRPNGTFLGVATGHGQIIANLHLVLPDDGEYKIELLNDYHLPRQAGSLKVAGLLPVDAGVWTGQPTDVPALGPMQAAQWTIKGKKGQQVPIFTRAAGYAFGDIWHGIEMLRPDGSRLRGESVYVAGLGSRWNVVLPEDGVYQFELLNSSVKPKPAGVYQVAGLLPVDSGIWTGQITGVPALGPRQTARWIFEGKRGQKIPFSALNVTDSAHSYRLTVYRPDGTRLDASFGYAPLEQGGLPAYLDLVMPDDGMYTIELSNESWTPRPAGTYEVSGLLPVAAGVWAGQSTGVPALGPMQAARWILVGRKGQEIPLSATRAPGTNTNYMLAVYSPSGTLLNTALANDRSRISLDVVIPENGSYTVELRNFSWTRTAANTFNVSG